MEYEEYSFSFNYDGMLFFKELLKEFINFFNNEGLLFEEDLHFFQSESEATQKKIKFFHESGISGNVFHLKIKARKIKDIDLEEQLETMIRNLE